jgi:hypothetical protein
MNFFKKTPGERYQAAFEKTYALETRGATLCVSCNGTTLDLPRTEEGYARAAAFLEEQKVPLRVRIAKRMRIF